MERFRDIAKIITGKGIIVVKKYIDVFQSTKNIFVSEIVTPTEYYIVHEICHYIIASSEDRNKYNLRFGKEHSYGYQIPDSDETSECLKEERIVGELQIYLLKEANLYNVLFPTQSKSICDKYFEYIRTINKPEDEPSLLPEALKRLEETNKELGIDILELFKELSIIQSPQTT